MRRAQTSGPEREDVDVLVISPRTTPGLRRDHEELVAALHRLGVSMAQATSTYGLLNRLRGLAYVVDEFVVLGGMWHGTRRALRRVRPKAVLITTSIAGSLLPAELLERAAVRFDGLAAGTRRQWWALPTRLLERRILRRAKLLLPYSNAVAAEATELAHATRPSIVWPSPVRPGPEQASERWQAGLCYANDPYKKGLDLAVEAWRLAAPPNHRLYVAGIEPASGRRFLATRGVEVPENIEWCGRLPEPDYRRLSASVLVYIGASRVDEFATTQLEALADGALLVTGPSRGPIEALNLARALDSRLVASEMTPGAIAAALGQALSLSRQERADYQRQAHELLEPYSREAFTSRLRDDVLPILLGT